MHNKEVSLRRDRNPVGHKNKRRRQRWAAGYGANTVQPSLVEERKRGEVKSWEETIT
jgi:hypothetical protein